MRCSVLNCANDTRRTTKSHGITFHIFPKEQKLRTAWLEALGMPYWEPKDRSAVCSDHFRTEDFYITKSGLRRVTYGAVPVDVSICDSAEDLDAPAAMRVCRVCLAMDMKMYHLSQHKLNLAYEQVIGVPFSDDDKLPLKICWECAQRLLSARNFKNRALRSQTILYELMEPDKYITVKDIKSIDRTQKQLASTLVYKHFEPNVCDAYVEDNPVLVKEESIETLEERDEEVREEDIDDRSDEEIKEEVAPNLVPNDIKDEATNEIFLEEFENHFDESDDMALSEVYDVTKKVKKKKRVKVGKKVKVKKPAKKKGGDESPTRTMDKYKTSDVKRRRTIDNVDETLFTITPLTYEEQVAEVQRRQLQLAYTSAPYQCAVCFRGFLRKDRYDAHALRHTDQSGAYECFICRTRLKTARALRKHLTAQHTQQYSCKGCTFVTRNKGVAREHEKWHAGAKYQCPHCPSEFDKMTTYLGHVRIKHVSCFVCELCGFTFVSKKGIDVHKKKKHRMSAVDKLVMDGPYCEICDVRFISEEAHERHLKLSSKHSSDDDPNRIRNDSQSAGAESGRTVRRIERRPVVHRLPTDEQAASGLVSCEQCGIQLRDLRRYAQHFRRAHPDKNRTKYPAMKTPCMCEQCGRLFQSMALLKDHMWVHTGEKRFKCERCDKSFTQKTNLVFHMRVHSAQRPSFECPLCGKHFAFYNNRRRHMFIHTGLKPYKCDTCGKSFTTAGEQRAHVEHVHQKKPWPKRARAPRDSWLRCDERVED